MTNSPTELDTLLIESLQRLTEHLDAQTTRLDEQTTRIEHLTKQLNELPALALIHRRSLGLVRRVNAEMPFNAGILGVLYAPDPQLEGHLADATFSRLASDVSNVR